MPRYHHQGPGQMKRVDATRAKTPELSEPQSPDIDAGDEEQTQLFVCRVEDCDRRFKKRMILARHFNASHDELREDSDSWREFCEEIWV